MSVYILDTDTLSLAVHKHRRVRDHLGAVRSAGHVVGLTVITVEEQCTGWLAASRAARSPAKLAETSAAFAEAATTWGQFVIFPQTEASLARFEQLVRLKLNVGRMDLRIASIALEIGATIVTRNRRDFTRVPGLASTDWAAT